MLPLFSYLEPKLKWLLKVRQACAATALNTSGELLYCNNRGDTHCSQVCPHLGTQVPMRTFFRFLHVFSNLYFKELTCLDKFSKILFFGSPIVLVKVPIRSPSHSKFGPHWVPILNKIWSPLHLVQCRATTPTGPIVVGLAELKWRNETSKIFFSHRFNYKKCKKKSW